MGFFKKILGDSAENLNKKIGLGRDAVQGLKEIMGSHSYDDNNIIETTRRSSKREDEEGTIPCKQLWWIRNLTLLYDGNKYALKYKENSKDKGKRTRYIYDDVQLLNNYQVRIEQKQSDGTLRYGVVSVFRSFKITDCEYTKVTFLDGNLAVLAIDEDGDEYAINRWGDIYSLEAYIEQKTEE